MSETDCFVWEVYFSNGTHRSERSHEHAESDTAMRCVTTEERKKRPTTIESLSSLGRYPAQPSNSHSHMVRKEDLRRACGGIEISLVNIVRDHRADANKLGRDGAGATEEHE